MFIVRFYSFKRPFDALNELLLDRCEQLILVQVNGAGTQVEVNHLVELPVPQLIVHVSREPR